MSRPTLALVGLVVSLAALAATAHAEVVRPGDRFKIRLDAALSKFSSAGGKSVWVTVPDGLRADPKSAAEIPAGTKGWVVFKLVEKAPTTFKYEVSSFSFTPRDKSIPIETQVAKLDATSGTAPLQKVSMVKKLLLPPLLGFLIWKDRATLEAGKELMVEVTKEQRW